MKVRGFLAHTFWDRATAVAVVIGGASVAVAMASLLFATPMFEEQKPPDETAERVQELISALGDAQGVLEGLSSQLEARAVQLDEVEAELARLQALQLISEEQVDALLERLENQPVPVVDRWWFRILVSIIIASIFFLLGRWERRRGHVAIAKPDVDDG